MKTVIIRNVVIGEGIPKICVSITGEDRGAIEGELKELLEAKPDLAEWRVDCYKGENEEDLWQTLELIRDKLRDIPVLFTFRTRQEGGEKDLVYENYEKLLIKAAKTKKADLIDVEVFFCEEKSKALISEIHKEGVKVIASNHHFHETPVADELIARMKAMDVYGADILKMAVMPADEMDLCQVLEATVRIKKECEKPVVTMSMGKIGVLSRLWGEFTGSCITFAAGRKASAPGQIPVVIMKHVLETLHNIIEK